MKSIPDAHKKVPMMFRAQVSGRSQLHDIPPSAPSTVTCAVRVGGSASIPQALSKDTQDRAV